MQSGSSQFSWQKLDVLEGSPAVMVTIDAVRVKTFDLQVCDRGPFFFYCFSSTYSIFVYSARFTQ